ncbi:MAG TPA: hypothetical protein GXX19_13225 [Syntrophomonadaceae bacterium]|nr:hypothetical protein [Syntrophomonadaceae bacterium]
MLPTKNLIYTGKKLHEAHIKVVISSLLVCLIIIMGSCSGPSGNLEHQYLYALSNNLDIDIVRFQLGLSNICSELVTSNIDKAPLDKLYLLNAKLEQFLIYNKLDTIAELDRNVNPKIRTKIVGEVLWNAGFPEMQTVYVAVKHFRDAFVKPSIAIMEKGGRLTEKQLENWSWARQQILNINKELAKIKRGSSEDFIKPDFTQIEAVKNILNMSRILCKREL